MSNPAPEQQPAQNSAQDQSRPPNRGNFRGRSRGGPPRNSRITKTAEVNEVDASQLEQELHQNDGESTLEAFQNDKNSPLYPLKPFEEIITGQYSAAILQSIDDNDFFKPSKIQSQAIPALNADKKDLVAQAQSGSGKTIAFIISMLLHVDGNLKAPQAVCLSHTRELTLQTFEVFNKINTYTNFKGGVLTHNINQIDDDTQLIFGTPAAIKTAFNNNKIKKDNINLLVVDEADDILKQNGSHIGSTLTIIKKILNPNCQLAFFSATFPKDVIGRIKKLRPNILQIRLKRNQQFVQTVSHWLTIVKDDDEAKECLLRVVNARSSGRQTYVFANSKKLVHEISEYLKQNNITCSEFSSDLSPEQRDLVLKDFRDGKFLILITSDVLARGIDIPNTYMVINIHIPITRNPHNDRFVPDSDTYYHRAGRAGRFGRTGICFNILLEREEDKLKFFCGQLGIKLNKISSSALSQLPEEQEASQVQQEKEEEPTEQQPESSETA